MISQGTQPRSRLPLFIVGATLLGIVTGWACHEGLETTGSQMAAARDFSIVTDVFLRLIRMIIGPLVFSTLVAGIARVEDSKTLGRIGLGAFIWFAGASLISLALGITAVELLQPGAGMHLTVPTAGGPAVPDFDRPLTLSQIVVHAFPTSIAQALAKNEILQVVVFSLFLGLAIAQVRDRAQTLLRLFDELATVMLKITGYVMCFAPIAIFAALASVITTYGFDVLIRYAKFVGGFYAVLVLLCFLLLLAGAMLIGRSNAWRLAGAVREPAVLAFATASSEAAYPGLLDSLQRFGVPGPIAGFVLPLGYSFNLDGTMLYSAFATLFIAQAYDTRFDATTLATLAFVLLMAGKGIAGVPRASLVIVAAALSFLKIPSSSMVLLLAVDQLFDMGRSAVNVIGNSVATAAIAAREGHLGGGGPIARVAGDRIAGNAHPGQTRVEPAADFASRSDPPMD